MASIRMLRQRAQHELPEIDSVAKHHAGRFAVVPLLEQEPVGVDRLRDLANPIIEKVRHGQEKPQRTVHPRRELCLGIMAEVINPRRSPPCLLNVKSR